MLAHIRSTAEQLHPVVTASSLHAPEVTKSVDERARLLEQMR